METATQEKAESAIPVTTLSPPEGNTTFLGGTTLCVALSGVSQIDLQNALDWTCGLGMADCSPIQEGGACFDPDTLVSHASYAFNNYYQQNENSEIACNFGGTAVLTRKDPSKKSLAFTFFSFTLLYLVVRSFLDDVQKNRVELDSFNEELQIYASNMTFGFY
jgi:hypothetical protein